MNNKAPIYARVSSVEEQMSSGLLRSPDSEEPSVMKPKN